MMASRGDFSLESLDADEPGIRSSPGYPGGLNGAEFAHCSQPWNMPNCAKAKSAADDASARARGKFPQATLHEGKGDAYRHCYWSARMTIDMGLGEAQGFGDRHEAASPAGPDKNMDLENNATGRSVGQSHRSHNSASDRCEDLARNGKLVTLK